MAALPELAYGDAGYPPKVPPGATMIYTIRVENVREEKYPRRGRNRKKRLSQIRQKRPEIMILNKCRLIETVAAGLLFVSVQSVAADIPIKITGIIQIPLSGE